MQNSFGLKLKSTLDYSFLFFLSDDEAWANWRRKDNEEEYHREKLRYVEYGDCADITPSNMAAACPSKYKWQLVRLNKIQYFVQQNGNRLMGCEPKVKFNISTLAELALKIHFNSVFF